MIYTLAKFFLWGLGFAVIGGIIGWMLRGRRCCQQLIAARTTVVDKAEADRLRNRVANLEPLIGERDALQDRVAELEAAAKGAGSGAAASGGALGFAGGLDAGTSGALEAAEATASVAADGDASAEDPTLADGMPRPELGDAEAQADVAADVALDGPADDVSGLDSLSAGLPEMSADAPIADAPADVSGAVHPLAGFSVEHDAEAAKAALGVAVEADDLAVVEGIGPKLSETLNNAGVTTWLHLADSSPERISDTLVADDARNRMHDTTTWPRQARLAALGEWGALKSLQDTLRAGRDDGGEGAGSSGIQSLAGLGVADDLAAAKAILGTKVVQDDLELVEGIGPKLREVLNAAGVSTWAQLGRMSPDAIRETLVAADARHRMHDPGSWPRQARLAALGEWAALKALQDQLNAGR